MLTNIHRTAQSNPLRQSSSVTAIDAFVRPAHALLCPRSSIPPSTRTLRLLCRPLAPRPLSKLSVRVPLPESGFASPAAEVCAAQIWNMRASGSGALDTYHLSAAWVSASARGIEACPVVAEESALEHVKSNRRPTAMPKMLGNSKMFHAASARRRRALAAAQGVYRTARWVRGTPDTRSKG